MAFFPDPTLHLGTVLDVREVGTPAFSSILNCLQSFGPLGGIGLIGMVLEYLTHLWDWNLHHV